MRPKLLSERLETSPLFVRNFTALPLTRPDPAMLIGMNPFCEIGV
jgi:hypothetical protein